jgi:non-specific serine/threonine protein kinase
MSDTFQPEPAPVPVPLTSFIGREREIETVTALLLRPDLRLLTLTGPGGIGKSRLALRVVETLRDAYPGGVGFVPLAPVRDSDLVLPTVAQALNVPDTAHRPLPEQLQAYMAGRHMLLLLDNLEHLLEAIAPLVSGLLAHCPHLNVLTTSRVRLGISGEQVVPVEPLPPETARALFAIRARAAEPSFAATVETTPVIDAICARLDRLPLAIELAAARVGVLPPPALLTRLEHRLDLLTGGPRDAPARQRDMRDTIAWSHDLLTEPERAIFRRLGVFAGGFTLEATAAVAGEDLDAVAGVSALMAASLVIRVAGEGDEPRFTMLETIREYALEQLAASGEAPGIRRLHAYAFLALAETAWEAPDGPITERWIRRLRPEIGNLRVALAWALDDDPDKAEQLFGALVLYWVMHGSLTEGRDLAERMLQRNPGAPDRHRARLLLAAGWLAMDHGDLTIAETHLTEAVARARDADDERLLIECWSILGLVALKGNHPERARQLFDEVRMRTVRSEPIHLAMTTANLGQVAMAMGDLPEAQDLFEEALAIHQAGSGPTGVGFGYMYLGQLLVARRAYARAVACFRTSFTLFAGAVGPSLAVRPLEGLASAVVTSQPAVAARLLAAAAVIRDEDGRPRDVLEAPAYDQTVVAATTALGETAFAAAWEAGTRLAWDQVCAEVDALADAIADSADVSPTLAGTHGLSLREREVLRLVAEGHSNRAIADRLSISQRTVENHVGHILDKLGLDSRTAAATWAVRHDLT